MIKTLAISIIAAMSGSVFAVPSTSSAARRSDVSQIRPAVSEEPSEKQRIMLEVRRQVGGELRDS